MLETMKTLIRESDLCVLATSGPEGPHASLMACICSADAGTLYLVTARQSQKFRNIALDSRVSVLLDTREKDPRGIIRALTLHGQARIAPEGAEKDEMLARFARTHPHLEGLIHRGDIALVVIRIRSLQLLNGPQEAHHVVIP